MPTRRADHRGEAARRLPASSAGESRDAFRPSLSRRSAIGLRLAPGLRRRRAHAASLDEALAHFTADDFDETDDRRSTRSPPAAVRGRKSSSRALQNGQLMFSAEQQGGLHPGRRRQAVRRRHRPAGRRRAAGRSRHRAHQQSAARRDRRRARRPDAAVATIRDKRYDAAQAVFKSREASALPTLEKAHRQGNRRRRQARAGAGARRHRAQHADASATRDKLAAIAVDPRPRRPGRAGAARRHRRPRVAAGRARPRLPRSPPSRRGLPNGTPCRTPGTGFRSARCCCSPRSGLPSPSA